MNVGVLAQLPDRINLRRGVSRLRLKNMPSNPQTINDLEKIATTFRTTMAGEVFILYDSYEDEDEDYDGGRIIIFATKENLRNLFRCTVWFVDGTFRCSPNIFFQLFAILGAVQQVSDRETHSIGLPFVYALLQNKQEVSYKKIYEVIIAKATEHNINVRHPVSIMTDFELAIINATKEFFTADKVRCCLFHLGQSVYRYILIYS